jgi:nucleoside-specific outer membrane channel protein Tsx
MNMPAPQATDTASPAQHASFRVPAGSACWALALAFALPGAVHAAQWSDTEIQLLHGDRFHDKGDQVDISKTIVTLQHASGWAYGRNFFFVDLLKSDGHDEHAGEAYGEFYSTFSAAKIGGFDGSRHVLKDVGLTLGLNYGAKNNAFRSNPRVLLAGPTFDLGLPHFTFFNVDVLAYHDTGTFSGFGGGHLCGRAATTYQVTPSWKLPFTLGGEKFSFEGFLDWIGPHGTCAQQVLTQPQLRWDLGNHWGKPDQVFLGLEYQYWNNKFGVHGQRDNLVQALLVWKL